MFPPDLLPGADEWLSAFWELATDRQIGMAAGPIPSSAIDRWIDRNGMMPCEAETFRRCIRAMEAAHAKPKEMDTAGMSAMLHGLAKGGGDGS